MRRLRRASQILCLIGFLWLFVATEYRGLDRIPWPVSLLFRIDPLAALADALAPGPFGWRLLWPALALLALTAVWGRFFCGWICPLGTTLDGVSPFVGRRRERRRPQLRRIKYLLLAGLGVAALFGVQIIGWFDPLSIFLRGLTFSLYPLYNLAANEVFTFFYQHPVPGLSAGLDALYPFWRDHLMAFHQPSFALGLFTLVVFVAILLLERLERRFWCRYLCPLGALLGLCARHALVQREPAELCGGCALCTSSCRMAATDQDGHRGSECIRCFDCTDYCPAEKVRFAPGIPAGAGVDVGRRQLITSMAAGALAAPVVSLAPPAAKQNPYLIRPPGAVAEEDFLRRCIRCGECLKVCIGQALQPALLQTGPFGLWTPLVVARHGYCEYNCTLCGQVCPTGAIRRLEPAAKKAFVIGLARIDQRTCLPYARGEECLVCEEHCPTPQKAIVFDQRQVLVNGRVKTLKQPRVVAERCIGCGICETRCPLEGVSAIRVINERESRRERNGLLQG